MAASKTLLFIQKTAVRGGAINRLFDTLSTLQKATDYRLHIVCSEQGEFTERCAELGFPVTLHALPEWRKLRERLRFHGAIKSLCKSLPFTEADWVISNEMWWAPHAAAIAKKLKAKSAAILRDGIADAHKGRKYRLQDNDLILPSSLKIAQGMQSDSVLAKRTQVFHDAVFLPELKPDSAASLQHQLNLKSSEVQRWLVVIGRLSSRKRQVDSVLVLQGLIQRGYTDFGLILAGDCDPDYESKMDEVLHNTGLKNRVVRLGNFTDIRALFAMNPICLLTSLREALPGSVMESLLAGKPCFMYPCEGAEDIFGPHQNLFVSGDFKPELLVDKIDFLLQDPTLLASQVVALQQRAESMFSFEAHLRGLQQTLGLEI